MATQIKKHEKVVLPTFKNGVNIQFFAIDFQSAVNGLLEATTAGVPSPVVLALQAVQSACSIETIHTLVDTNTKLVIGVAAIGGDYEGADWDSDGANPSESFASHLEDLIQAVTVSGSATVRGIDMSAITVAAYTVGNAA